MIDRLAKELDPSTDAATIVHAGIIGMVSFPLGITGEINFLPEIKNSDIDFSTRSIAVKWTPTKLWALPVDMAIKVFGGLRELKWNQLVSLVATDVQYEQKVSGLIFQVSKQFAIFEPYLNLGSVRATGELASSGGSVFDAAYTVSSRAEEEVLGGIFMIAPTLIYYL